MTPKADTIDYVTATAGSQWFGLPITAVRDVFVPERITRVPLSGRDVAGVLSLRGRIVTIIDMNAALGLPPRVDDQPGIVIGVEFRGESYGLLFTTVGEVLSLPIEQRHANPAHLDPRLAELSNGIHYLDSKLLLVLDVGRVIGETSSAAFAA